MLTIGDATRLGVAIESRLGGLAGTGLDGTNMRLSSRDMLAIDIFFCVKVREGEVDLHRGAIWTSFYLLPIQRPLTLKDNKVGKTGAI